MGVLFGFPKLERSQIHVNYEKFDTTVRRDPFLKVVQLPSMRHLIC